MNATEPTYFLYSGLLFHEAALSGPRPRPEDPGPEGPEGEPVGDKDKEDSSDAEGLTENKPSPGPGQPIIPDNGTPDADLKGARVS